MKTNTPKRQPLKLPFKCETTKDFRIVSLERDGVLCIPVFGLSDYHGPREQASPHTHPECLEISYCLRGELAFSCQGRNVPFRSGRVFVTRPNETHCLLTPDKGLRMYWMFFRIPKRRFPFLKLPISEAEWLKESLVNMPNRCFPATKRLDAAFKRILSLYDTLPGNTPGRRLQMRTAATELLLSLVEASSATASELDGGKVETLIDEIRSAPGREYSIDVLSRRAGLSPSSLALRFKALVGVPPHSFVLRCRIAAAKAALFDPGAKVADIAQSLGFPSAQHFSTQFKNATGKTPREWKESSSPL